MSLTRQAFERIRGAIVSGGLEFGEPLSETQIAKALGMSKAPVRAAFMELRDKGLVTIVPQSGTYVFSPTPDDVRTLSHFRALLENEALQEAMKRSPDTVLAKLEEAIVGMRRAMATKDWDIYRRADSTFHLAFLEESGNRYLMRAYDLGAAALEALRVRLQRAGNFRKQSFGEHIDIAGMLRTGDINGACRLLRSHILVITQSLDTLPLTPSKGSRKDQSPARNYAEVFSPLRATADQRADAKVRISAVGGKQRRGSRGHGAALRASAARR